MSGGHFEYKQSYIKPIADEIEIFLNNIYASQYLLAKTRKEIEKGLIILRKAAIYAQRIDWLISGDDGQDDFMQRLKDELDELEGK